MPPLCFLEREPRLRREAGRTSGLRPCALGGRFDSGQQPGDSLPGREAGPRRPPAWTSLGMSEAHEAWPSPCSQGRT